MDSDQELKSLKRGLRAMTLLAEGFVDRDRETKRYFLTARVRALSHGFGDEGWIAHVATPMLFETTQQIGCPCASRHRSASI